MTAHRPSLPLLCRVSPSRNLYYILQIYTFGFALVTRWGMGEFVITRTRLGISQMISASVTCTPPALGIPTTPRPQVADPSPYSKPRPKSPGPARSGHPQRPYISRSGISVRSRAGCSFGSAQHDTRASRAMSDQCVHELELDGAQMK